MRYGCFFDKWRFYVLVFNIQITDELRGLMLPIIVYDKNNQKIKPSTDLTAAIFRKTSLQNFSAKEKFCYAINAGTDLVDIYDSANLSLSVFFSTVCHFLSNVDQMKTSAKNMQLMNELIELEKKSNEYTRHSLMHYLKVLQCFDVPDVSHIEYDLGVGYTKTQQHFDEIRFPEDLIPEKYKCMLTTFVMSEPCQLGFEKVADKASLKPNKNGILLNPFTKQPIENLTVDQALLKEIELFIRKAQLVYYLSADSNATYNKLKNLLIDPAVTYESFRNNLTQSNEVGFFANAGSSTTSSSQQSHLPVPPMDIFEIFIKYGMKELRPTKLDYEALVRKIAGKGDEHSLGIVLLNPLIMDVIKPDLNACGVTGQRNALHWLVIKANDPNNTVDKVEQYRRCYNMLETHISSDIKDEVGKTAMEYDTKGVFLAHSASMNR